MIPFSTTCPWGVMLRLIQDMRGRTCLHRAAASGQADALFAVKATFQGFPRGGIFQ